LIIALRYKYLATMAAVASFEYDYVAVLDFEANCIPRVDRDPEWADRLAPILETLGTTAKKFKAEIVEFPTVILRRSGGQFEKVDEFRVYVQPAFHGVSDFCTHLTGITPEMSASDGARFLDALRRWVSFMEKYPKSLLLCCGDWDLSTMLPKQFKACSEQPAKFFAHEEAKADDIFRDLLRRFGVVLGGKWCNLKKIFADEEKLEFPVDMDGMLKHAKLTLEGRHHSGLDDCRNIAKVCQWIAERHGIDKVYPTETNALQYYKKFLPQQPAAAVVAPAVAVAAGQEPAAAAKDASPSKEDWFLTNSYAGGCGFAPSAADRELYEKLSTTTGEPSTPAYGRWYRHIDSFTPFQRSEWQ